MNHFFNSSTSSSSSLVTSSISTETPLKRDPSISFTAIYQDDDILTFQNFDNTTISENEKLSKIGLIKGITEFSCKFDDSTHVKHIDTEKQRFIIGSVVENDKRIIVVLCLNLGYVITDESANKKKKDKIQYDSKKIANSDYLTKLLTRGLKIFQLNHGNILDHKEIISQWWHSFITNLFNNNHEQNFNYLTNGFISKFDIVKKSSLELPIGFNKNLDLKIDSVINDDANLLHISVMNLVQTPFENYGLIYNSKPKLKEINENDIYELIKYLQFIDLQNELSEDSIMCDNLIPLKSKPTTTITTSTLQTQDNPNSLMNFFNDPLTPMIYDPFNATVDAVTNAGSYLPNLKFWDQSGSADDTNDNIPEVDEPIVKQQCMFLTGKFGKNIYFNNKNYKLVLYKIENFLISMIFANDDDDDDDKGDDDQSKTNDKLESMIINEIYEIYLSDIKQKFKQESFQYLIINNDNYYSSVPLIEETNYKQQILLNNSILNFLNVVDFELNHESIIKNLKEYWVFYHNNVVKSQKILLIKKNEINDNDSKNSDQRNNNNDLKKLFMTSEKRKSKNSLAIANQTNNNGDYDNNSDDDDDFVSTLGIDVYRFWKTLIKDNDYFN